MKKKRIAALLTMAVFTTMVAGCGGSSGGNTSGSAPAQEETKEEEAAEEAEETTDTAQTAEAGSWTPSSNVEFIVGFAAGGGMDTMARTVSTYIDLDGGSSFVTNIEGSGSAVAGMEFYHRDPDGFSLFFSSPESQACNYINGALTENLNADCIPVASLCYDCNVISVGADSPFNTMEELLDYAKEHPGELTFASISVGSYMWTSAQSLFASIGPDLLNYVPYDSAAKSRTAVIGGNEDIFWGQIAEALPFVESGELKILATTTTERTDYLPDVPTMEELGYPGEYGLHRSVWLPPETPDEVVQYYNRALKEVFDNEEFKSVIEGLGYILTYDDPAAMKTITADVQSWAEDILQ